MSKRDLKKYLSGLTKSQLEEQVLDLYERFRDVKTLYNFAFQPKEEKLLEDAKIKIGKEYFPLGKRKAKARRSVAQKIIKHWRQLGVEYSVVTEIMLFNINIAQQYSAEKTKLPDAFYKSILNSYKAAIAFILKEGIARDFAVKFQKIADETNHQKWINAQDFQDALQPLLKK